MTLLTVHVWMVSRSQMTLLLPKMELEKIPSIGYDMTIPARCGTGQQLGGSVEQSRNLFLFVLIIGHGP
jgi:hypothetical protein